MLIEDFTIAARNLISRPRIVNIANGIRSSHTHSRFTNVRRDIVGENLARIQEFPLLFPIIVNSTMTRARAHRRITYRPTRRWFADYDFRRGPFTSHLVRCAHERERKLSQSSCNNSRAGLHIAVRIIFATSHFAFTCCKILRLAYSLIQDRKELTLFICI